MPRTFAASDAVRISKATRALLIVSLVLAIGLSVETLGAPWELRIDIPGATSVGVRDISSNRQYAVGFYSTPQGSSNFLWRAGEVTTISIPGAFTQLTGVNASGDLTGQAVFLTGGSEPMTFLRSRDGTITFISCPNSPVSVVWSTAINNTRTVVGFWGFRREEGGRVGFRWRSGRCEQLPLRDIAVMPADISENGIIVGTAASDGDEFAHRYGFMIHGAHVVTVEHPEALVANGGFTSLTTVAPNGLAVGWMSPNEGSLLNIQWFLYRDGMFDSLAVPRPGFRFNPLSISSSGVITYGDTDGVIRAFRVPSTLTHF